MSVAYDCKCDVCGKSVGSVTFEAEPTEERRLSATSGYVCGECMPAPEGEE